MLLFNLSQARFEVVQLGKQAVLLKLHQHLLLDSSLIVSRERLECLLILLVGLLVLRDVIVKLKLLLLHTSVIDLLEVSLLSELIVCGAGLLSSDARLIEVLLKHCQLVRESAIRTIDLWDLRQF